MRTVRYHNHFYDIQNSYCKHIHDGSDSDNSDIQDIVPLDIVDHSDTVAADSRLFADIQIVLDMGDNLDQDFLDQVEASCS